MENDLLTKYQEVCGLLLDALKTYANPEFYHAMIIIPDNPSGGFAKDFSNADKLGFNYERKMPGKLARKTIKKLNKKYGYLVIFTKD